jgi:hypothetical protein
MEKNSRRRADVLIGISNLRARQVWQLGNSTKKRVNTHDAPFFPTVELVGLLSVT